MSSTQIELIRALRVHGQKIYLRTAQDVRRDVVEARICTFNMRICHEVVFTHEWLLRRGSIDILYHLWDDFIHHYADLLNFSGGLS